MDCANYLDRADVDSMRLDSLPDAAQQSTHGPSSNMDMVPATPTMAPQAFTTVSEEMREHIQVSLAMLQCFYMQSCLPPVVSHLFYMRHHNLSNLARLSHIGQARLVLACEETERALRNIVVAYTG